jgi:hypothetical protein
MNGNEKLRQALEQIHELLSIGGKPDTAMCIRYEAANQMAKAALAEPLRNCDVGTAEEQMERHYIFCSRNTKCHPDSSRCMMCYAKWSQMPYEEVKQ